MRKEILANIKDGDLFTIAGIEFIKFFDKDGKTFVVAKDSLFNSEFGDNNNFATSIIKKRLEDEILPKIEKEIGAENVLEHEVDLFSLDGSNKWGKVNCKISLPTFDFYRNNRKTFEKYKLGKWYWLSTPDSTSEFYLNDDWIVCVSPSGNIDDNICDDYGGVRPFLTFISSILVSCK